MRRRIGQAAIPLLLSMWATGANASVTIEENTTSFCGVNGVIATQWTGYSGAGYADTTNAVGSAVSWQVNIPTAGNYTVSWRYANGGTDNRNVNVQVDGFTKLSNVAFPPTGAWGTWSSLSQTVSITTAGSHRFRIAATTATGTANIDRFYVGQTATGASCSGSGSSSSSSSSSGGGFSSIVSEAQFNQMFPNRNAFYTYQGLVTAAAFYPAFAGTGDTAMRRREAAAAMANFAHETGGLVYITEIAQGEYCSGTATPCGVCAAGKRYYGRGPIQLSWNFNYCTAGQALGLNLWANPDLVQTDPAVAWKTALWYWMTQNGPGTMPAHNCIANNQGFGCTIRSINGSLECNGGNPAQVQSRINSFNTYKSILGTTSVGADGC